MEKVHELIDSERELQDDNISSVFRYSVLGLSGVTVLPTRRSRVRFPMRWIFKFT
jgi:hypothetical protein